jgi:tetratricopeptide (TPR) repeat protein
VSQIRFFVAVSVLLAACAPAVSHKEFSVPGAAPDSPFISSQELLTSGLLSEGLSLSTKSRLIDASFRVQQALYLDPTNARLQLTLALMLRQMGELEESVKMFSRLYATQPRNPDVLVGYADALVASDKHEEGRRLLKEAFRLFTGAGNLPQAARLARSISNVAFGVGDEQEALCYSYEALMLSPLPDQVAAHGKLLVGLNLATRAIQAIDEAAVLNPPVLRSARVQHVRALSFYATGDFVRAVDAADLAIQYLSKDPEISSEVFAARWLAISKIDRSQDTEVEIQRYEEQRQEVVDFAARAGFELVFWPPDMTAALQAEAAASDTDVAAKS